MRSFGVTFFLLTQASLTPAAAAKLWSTVKSEAGALGADIVSPAVNFCGGDCNQEVGKGEGRTEAVSPTYLSAIVRPDGGAFWRVKFQRGKCVIVLSTTLTCASGDLFRFFFACRLPSPIHRNRGGDYVTTHVPRHRRTRTNGWTSSSRNAEASMEAAE